MGGVARLDERDTAHCKVYCSVLLLIAAIRSGAGSIPGRANIQKLSRPHNKKAEDMQNLSQMQAAGHTIYG